MLLDILQNKKCFKLICGAGNEDEEEVEKLTMLYSKAGCCFFDLSANDKIIDAAKRGLKRSGITKDRYICCSVGLKGDPHIQKAKIDKEKCTLCNLCSNVCPQNAIADCEINQKRCIGCGKCADICPQNTVIMENQVKDLKEILPTLIKNGIDCIELHCSTENIDEIVEKWGEIKGLFKGPMSICLNRSKLSDEKLVSLIKKLGPAMVQADGAPMSGGRDDFGTTLQTVALAQMLERANLNVYLLLSGGTNSKSSELSKLCGVNINGVAIGSYARKIVGDYINRSDFFENEEVFNSALKIAKELVDVSLKNLLETTK